MLFALRINILAKGYRFVKHVLCSCVAEKWGKIIKEDLAQVLFAKGAEGLIEQRAKNIFDLIY